MRTCRSVTYRNVTCRNVKNRTEFYLLRSSRKSRKRAVSYVTLKLLRIISALRKNILRYVKFSRMFLHNVKCLRYGTLRYVT